MTFEDFLNKAESKKIVFNEIDVPLSGLYWTNSSPGIWKTRIVLGMELVEDDRGNFGYYGNQNTRYYNLGSVTASGTPLTKVASLVECLDTEQSFFFDQSTTDVYVHLLNFDPVDAFLSVNVGAIFGFTDQEDNTVNNYFQDTYYEARIKRIPNITKRRDSFFFGKLQYPSLSITYDNTDGFFDNFPELNLYGQPFRIKLSFEGLDYSQALTVYTGRVDKFVGNFAEYKLSVIDLRKLLARTLPVNKFNTSDFPDISEDIDGFAIPLIFGSVIKGPAYKISSGVWKFADTEFLDIDFGITVYREDGSIFSHGGTETDGIFTGTDTDDSLFVSCRQSTVENGLDVISHILDKYNGIPFSSGNYDTDEWNTEKSNVPNIGLWVGQGGLKTIVQVIEQVCTDSQGIFDPLADGRFSFRTFDKDKDPSVTFSQDDLMSDPQIVYDPAEFLSSVDIQYSKNIQAGTAQNYPNNLFEPEVFARYNQYRSRLIPSSLTSVEDSINLSDKIMDQAKEIKPIISFPVRVSYIGQKILANVSFIFGRQNGKIIIPESKYQILGIIVNLSTFQIQFIIKFIDNIPTEDQMIRVYKTIPSGLYKITPEGYFKYAIIKEGDL